MKPLDRLKKLKLNESIKKRPNVPLYALESALPKYTDKTANGLTRCILDFLELCDYQVERINTMGRPIDNRKQVTDVIGRTKTIGSMTWGKSTATKGSADISATIQGKSVKIEVKIGKDRQSQDQKNYQAKIEKSGGQYWIAKNFDDFIKKYDDFLESLKSIS
jgi:hypothetical protein